MRLPCCGRALLALLSLTVLSGLLAGVANAADVTGQITVTSMTQVSSVRISRTVYEYTYRITLKNSGVALSAVAATVTSSSPRTQIVDATVSAGDILANAVFTPPDTFSFRQDRAATFDPTALRWVSTGTSALAADTAITPARAPARLALLDASQNGAFDSGDVLAFLTTYAQAATDSDDDLEYSSYDLNGDGYTGGTRIANFDLNADGVITPDEMYMTDSHILCSYANSALFSGTRDQVQAGVSNVNETYGTHFTCAPSLVELDGFDGALSSSGAVVVDHTFRWTEEAGRQPFANLGADLEDMWAQGVSADGSTVVGHGNRRNCLNCSTWHEPFRWTAAEGLRFLGRPWSYATAVSRDGSVVVGRVSAGDGYSRAARWTADAGWTFLETSQEDSTASGVSDDGLVVVGATLDPSLSWSGCDRPFRWTESGLEFLNTHVWYACAVDVSGDGSVVVGTDQRHGFRWTRETGAVVLLSPVSPNDQTVAIASSADGSVVTGWADSFLNSGTGVWKGDQTLRNFADLLRDDYGLDVFCGSEDPDPYCSKVHLETATFDVSADGLTFLVDADGPSSQWLAKLAPICGDGVRQGVEQCDDGNTSAGDGCSELCQK